MIHTPWDRGAFPCAESPGTPHGRPQGCSGLPETVISRDVCADGLGDPEGGQPFTGRSRGRRDATLKLSFVTADDQQMAI